MKNIPLILLAFVVSVTELKEVSTMSAVCLSAASITSSSDSVVVKKHKRKDCPVCKGKGWYISGDGIAKVDCGYCEPENKETQATEEDCCETEVIKG